ncbi:MAG: site-2 protease family protein [Planctomycetaceae bacterium]|nr:site-2 protease family protein [Planctomycetaceae bacterium]
MFGWPSDVILYHFGGVARFHHQMGNTTGRTVVVTFAGPWAGFVTYGIVVGVEYLLKQGNHLPVWGGAGEMYPWQLYAFDTLKFLNLFWGLVNLLPILPLDGGQISRALLEHFRPRDGLVWCLRIGTGVAAVASAVFLSFRMTFPGIFFAMFPINNFQMLEQYRHRRW